MTHEAPAPEPRHPPVPAAAPTPGPSTGVPAAARTTGRNLAAVAIGGACGAVLRTLLGMWFPDVPGAFPSTTLGINVAGSAALGAFTGYWQVGRHWPGWLRAGIGSGFLGAFTTFSTVILFALAAGPVMALLDLALSLLLCAAAAWAAMVLVERLLSGGTNTNRGAAGGPPTGATP